MEAGAELDQRRDAAVHLDAAARRLRDAGDELEHRALPRTVAADDAERAAAGDRERHVFQRRERLIRLQVRDQAAREQRALQRRELLALRIAAINLGDVGHFDGVHRYTSSAKESRMRSKTQYPTRNTTIDT